MKLSSPGSIVLLSQSFDVWCLRTASWLRFLKWASELKSERRVNDWSGAHGAQVFCRTKRKKSEQLNWTDYLARLASIYSTSCDFEAFFRDTVKFDDTPWNMLKWPWYLRTWKWARGSYHETSRTNTFKCHGHFIMIHGASPNVMVCPQKNFKFMISTVKDLFWPLLTTTVARCADIANIWTKINYLMANHRKWQKLAVMGKKSWENKLHCAIIWNFYLELQAFSDWVSFLSIKPFDT